MQTITSTDGVEIAYERYGEGRPLVLVHGSNDFRGTWQPVRPLLEDEFEMFAMDRRGRGASGDGDGYAFGREVDDVLAVIEAVSDETGENVAVVAQSFGGICSLEAARRTDAIERLVLHEPPILLDHHREAHMEMAAGMATQASEEGEAAALRWFLREGLELPTPLIENMPMWDQRLEFVSATRREIDAVGMYRPPESPDIDAPTLLLWGDESPDYLRETAEELADRLPEGEARELPGQNHVAHALAPEQFAEQVRNFLLDEAVAER